LNYPFKGLVRNNGKEGSCVVTIPVYFLKNDILEEGREYQFYVEVVDE